MKYLRIHFSNIHFFPHNWKFLIILKLHSKDSYIIYFYSYLDQSCKAIFFFLHIDWLEQKQKYIRNEPLGTWNEIHFYTSFDEFWK